MSQQASDLPRSVRILSRYKALLGLVAVLGVLGGVAVGALNRPVTTSSQALVEFSAPICPQGAICGGPMFSPGYAVGKMAIPAGVQVNVGPGNVLSITASGMTVAQAQAVADAVANQYIAFNGSLVYPGGAPAARVIEPATTVSVASPPKRLLDDALIGAVFGLLVGIIAALAAGQTLIEPVTLPRGVPVGGQPGGPGQPSGFGTTGYGPTGYPLQQIALDYANRTPAPDADRREAGNP